jgi:hypothetical protein
LTRRQRFTRLWTCSMRRRRGSSAWLAMCCSRVSASPRGCLRRHQDRHLGEREREEASSCNNPLPAGRGYGVERSEKSF